jgi:hypothetical protein
MAYLGDGNSVGPDGSPVRASDADRHATVTVLQDALRLGLLTPDEGSERMASAFAAVHLRDLDPLTADLPRPPVQRGRPLGWRVLSTMAVEQLLSSFRDNATGRWYRARVAVALMLLAILLLLAGGILAVDLFDGEAPHPEGFREH